MPLIKVGPAPETIRVTLLNQSADLLMKQQHGGSVTANPAVQALGGIPGAGTRQRVWQAFAEKIMGTNNPRIMRKLYKEFLTQENLTDG